MKKIKAIKGTRDITPSEVTAWTMIEGCARSVFRTFGFSELRTPIFESTDLFLRGIGEQTDIVQKEMYTFPDAKGRSITLRPEGTASVVRSYLEHSCDQQGSLHKFFYIGPMFRYERPQAGRMRQFHQIGVEAFGSSSPSFDADVIVLLMRFLAKLGIQGIQLKINSLGSSEDRETYRSELSAFLKPRLESLCEDCQTRYHKNLLRVLDCKKESCQAVIQQGPVLQDVLSSESLKQYQDLQELLNKAGVAYVCDPYLVRGLDYYSGPVFEVSCSSLGAQDAIAAGGRYDSLVKTLGGPPTPAVGFACGIERLILALPKDSLGDVQRDGVYWACLGETAMKECFSWAQQLRAKGLRCELAYDAKSLKSQMRYADKGQFRWVCMVGDNELEEGRLTVKDLDKGSEEQVELIHVLSWIEQQWKEG